jgi:integrase/rubredoxin
VLRHKGGEKAKRECPECHSEEINKNAFRETRKTPVQRYLCKKCGYRFSESSTLSTEHNNNAGRQIRVTLTEGTKNLTKVETRTKNRLAGATKISSENKGKLVKYSWNLKREGYAESTNETYTYLLKLFVKNGADLNNPVSVKDFIATQKTWSNGRKRNAVKAYDLYTKMNDLTWEKPKYKPVEKIPFIPTEKEIDSLISGCSKQMATFLQVLKETAARRGEAYNLKLKDIDFVSKTITITPLKGSKPRMFRMSDKLMTMINNLPKTTERLWIYKNVFYLDKGFRRQRKKDCS